MMLSLPGGEKGGISHCAKKIYTSYANACPVHIHPLYQLLGLDDRCSRIVGRGCYAQIHSIVTIFDHLFLRGLCKNCNIMISNEIQGNDSIRDTTTRLKGICLIARIIYALVRVTRH